MRIRDNKIQMEILKANRCIGFILEDRDLNCIMNLYTKILLTNLLAQKNNWLFQRCNFKFMKNKIFAKDIKTES